MSGVFPTFSKDDSKLAFVDNEFKAVWIADSQGVRIVFEVYNKISIATDVSGSATVAFCVIIHVLSFV